MDLLTDKFSSLEMEVTFLHEDRFVGGGKPEADVWDSLTHQRMDQMKERVFIIKSSANNFANLMNLPVCPIKRS